MELGPQGDLGAHHLDILRHLSPPAAAPEMAGQAHGLAGHHCFYSGDLYLRRGQPAAPRAAFLRKRVKRSSRLNALLEGSAFCDQRLCFDTDKEKTNLEFDKYANDYKIQKKQEKLKNIELEKEKMKHPRIRRKKNNFLLFELYISSIELTITALCGL